jgi:hypothetical protein
LDGDGKVRAVIVQNISDLRKQFVIWFVANILGFAALGVLALGLPYIVPISTPIILVFILTLSISIAQWIALRNLLKISFFWILTVPIGVLLGQGIINFLPSGFWPSADDEAIINFVFLFLIVGLAVGLLQWLLLQRKISRSLLWILGSCIGVAASIWIILITDMISYSGYIAYLVAVLIYTVITGVTLVGMQASNSKLEAYPLNTSTS